MPRQRWLPVALGAGTLLVVVGLAATSTPGPAVIFATSTPVARPSVWPTATPSPAGPTAMVSVEPNPVAQAVFDVVLWLLVAALAVAAFAFMVWLARTYVLRPPQMADGVRGAHEGGVEVGEVADDEIRETLADSLLRLRAGVDVGEAIVECWRRLEQVAGASGAERQPTDTAEEYTLTVMSSTSADATDLGELAELYRAAMFGGRTMAEDDRARALACLERLVVALGGEAR